jgi:glucokinase
MLVIGADIGGTHSRFGLFERDGGQLTLQSTRVLSSGDFASLEEALSAALRQLEVEPDAAGFGVPGPVREGRARITNLPWVVDTAKLSAVLGGRPARLLNDLEAQAWGIRWLGPDDLVELQPGRPGAAGNQAIISAGTGLGEAGLLWDGQTHHPFATEGGHADFGPGSALETELWAHLASAHGHVSWERLVSGPGLVNIFAFLLGRADSAASVEASELLSATDPAAAIAEAALAGHCRLCAQALELFVALYGAEAGNLALKTMATGGLYLGGGIAPKMLEALRQGRFLQRFTDKGRFAELLRSIPVRVIVSPYTALFGAAGAAISAP